MPPVGIREVADAAGLSVGTVSNVLNKPELVSEKTMTKVLAVMDQLGFVRNDLARQVKMGGGTTVAMIVLNSANPFFGSLAHACENEAERTGHTIVLGSSDQLAEREDRYIDLFEGQRVRGLLVTPLDGFSPRMLQTRKRGTPLVLFDVHAIDADCCSVALDGRAGGRLATSHLIERGRRRIAFIGGPLAQIADRWTAAEEAAAQAGVPIQRIDTPDQTIPHGREVGLRIAALPADERPDAVFAANDLLALGVMQGILANGGVSVPDDIAIIGYDDIEYAASSMVPLSTVRQPLDALAEHALRLLLDEAEDPESHTHRHLLLEPELVIRSST